jgi:hypothetical protein
MKQFALSLVHDQISYENFNTQKLYIGDLGVHFSSLLALLRTTETVTNRYNMIFHPPLWLPFEKESPVEFALFFAKDEMCDDEIKSELEFFDEQFTFQTHWKACRVKGYNDYKELYVTLGDLVVSMDLENGYIHSNRNSHLDEARVYDFSEDLPVLRYLQWLLPVLIEQFTAIINDKLAYYASLETQVGFDFRYSKISVEDYLPFARQVKEDLYVFTELTPAQRGQFLKESARYSQPVNAPMALSKPIILAIIQSGLSTMDFSVDDSAPEEIYRQHRLPHDPFHDDDKVDTFIALSESESDFDLWYETTQEYDRGIVLRIGEYRKSVVLNMARQPCGGYVITLYGGDDFYSAAGVLKMAMHLEGTLGLPVCIEGNDRYVRYLAGETVIGVYPEGTGYYRREKLELANKENDEYSYFLSTERLRTNKVPVSAVTLYPLDRYFM